MHFFFLNFIDVFLFSWVIHPVNLGYSMLLPFVLTEPLFGCICVFTLVIFELKTRRSSRGINFCFFDSFSFRNIRNIIR